MEIYAELSQKTLHEIEEIGVDLIVPSGVKWSRKWGSRGCYFEFDEDKKDELIDFLNSNRIAWQFVSENLEGSKKQQEKQKKEEQKTKRGGFVEFQDPWGENDHDDKNSSF